MLGFTGILESTRLPKITGQHYAFSLAIIRGMNPADAFQAAYPNQRKTDSLAQIAWKANRLLQHQTIKLWLDYLTRSHVQGAMRTTAEHIANLERIKIAALETGYVETAGKMEMAIGKVSGLYVDRSVIDVNHHVDADAVEVELVRRAPDLADRLTRFRVMLDGGDVDYTVIEGMAKRLPSTQDVVQEPVNTSRKRDDEP